MLNQAKKINITDSLKIGVALGGGGARGLTHIGILRALEKISKDAGYSPKIIKSIQEDSLLQTFYYIDLKAFLNFRKFFDRRC